MQNFIAVCFWAFDHLKLLLMKPIAYKIVDILVSVFPPSDRLCGLVVRVSGY
jgi:hypothetical protein